jgi:hypothetical protein
LLIAEKREAAGNHVDLGPLPVSGVTGEGVEGAELVHSCSCFALFACIVALILVLLSLELVFINGS